MSAVPSEIDWTTLAQSTLAERSAIALALSDWCQSQDDASYVLLEITSACRRVGVWLACAVARAVLFRVASENDAQRIAVETAESWVRGVASESDCCDAAKAARAANRSAYAASLAAASAAYAASNSLRTLRSDDAWNVGNFAASALDPSFPDTAEFYASQAGDEWYEARNRALRDLCGLIARESRAACDAAAEGMAAEIRSNGGER